VLTTTARRYYRAILLDRPLVTSARVRPPSLRRRNLYRGAKRSSFLKEPYRYFLYQRYFLDFVWDDVYAHFSSRGARSGVGLWFYS